MTHSWPGITDRAIRFALVGNGRIATRHARAIRSVAGAELTAVCDIDGAARERAASELDVPTFASLQQLLHGSHFDVAVLATPSGLHPDQAVACARDGHHVVTEKPIATRWADARRMVLECARSERGLFVVRQQRYAHAVQALRRAVDEDRFGRIHSVQLSLFWSRPQAYYELADWRGTWAFDGGALMNQGIHYVDLLRWLVGPIDAVQAFTATLDRDIEVEDSAALAIRWRAGTLGTVNLTMLARETNYMGSLTIIGERGTVRLGGVACDTIETWDFDEPRPVDADLLALDTSFDDVYGGGHRPMYEEVIRALRGDESAETVSGREALQAFEVVVAAYRAQRENRCISLPLES